MISVTSSPMELRGVVNKSSKSGKMYYVLNVESADGTPHALYCPNVDALPQGLKKGDSVLVSFSLTSFNGQERYYVTKVTRVEE